MLESDFELIVVNAPLPDEFGHELCSSAVEKTDAGVVLLAKAAAAEQLLAPMSEQGVLLLNTVLTVEQGAANAHAGYGWETFTRAALEYAAAQGTGPLAAVLWGKPAQKYAPIFNAAAARRLKGIHHPPAGVPWTPGAAVQKLHRKSLILTRIRIIIWCCMFCSGCRRIHTGKE